VLRNAPQGWDGQRFNMLRDLVYLGIMKSITVEFDFVGDGFVFLQAKKLRFGVDANVTYRLYKRHKFLFEGKINYENYDEDRKSNKFKVDIIQSTQIQKFNNREDVKINIFNNLSLDRLPVVPAALRNATIRGRKIKFYSEFDGVSSSGPELYHHIVPALLKINGNAGVKSAYNVYPDTWVPDSPGFVIEETFNNPLILVENAFYHNFLTEDQTVELVGEVDFTASVAFVLDPSDAEENFVVWRLLKVNQDNTVDEQLFYKLLSVRSGSITQTFTFDQSITVEPGQYLILLEERWGKPSPIGFILPLTTLSMDSGLRTEVNYNFIFMTIEQDSIVSDTVNPVILPHELFSALIAQINGGTFTSNLFGRTELGYYEDGAGAYVAITKGELLRGIDPTTVQVSTSMRDAFTSYSSIFCLGAIITETGIQIEPLDDLFNRNIALDIGEVSDLHMVPAKDFLFNSVLAGYPVNEYEEENGRDEPNTTYQYTNSLQAVKKELNIVSKYYGDGYGTEFARRQGVITSGTKDTRYDAQIFFIDLIKVGDDLISRRLEDILFVEGIFSPETAINLNIAVGQNMKRWRKFLNIPLNKKDKKYFFQSKDKNIGLKLVTALGTTNDGEDLDMGNEAYFIPELRLFNKAINVEMGVLSLLTNPLGLVKFTYKGERFYDILFEIDSETDKNKSEWRMLGTRDTPVQVEEDIINGDFLKYGDGPNDFVMYDSDVEDKIKYGDN
jgi:hypothetical protein